MKRRNFITGLAALPCVKAAMAITKPLGDFEEYTIWRLWESETGRLSDAVPSSWTWCRENAKEQFAIQWVDSQNRSRATRGVATRGWMKPEHYAFWVQDSDQIGVCKFCHRDDCWQSSCFGESCPEQMRVFKAMERAGSPDASFEEWGGEFITVAEFKRLGLEDMWVVHRQRIEALAREKYGRYWDKEA